MTVLDWIIVAIVLVVIVAIALAILNLLIYLIPIVAIAGIIIWLFYHFSKRSFSDDVLNFINKRIAKKQKMSNEDDFDSTGRKPARDVTTKDIDD